MFSYIGSKLVFTLAQQLIELCAKSFLTFRTLLIKKIKESDVGVYTCSAKNKEGSAESSGNLEIVEIIEKGRSDAPGNFFEKK